MRNFLYNQRGAISVFLIIVMVPMLTVAGVFVDASRLELAKSMASAAGDLALNTALTDYDTVLKEVYGLFAVSQDIDDLLDNLEDYYKKSIEAAGVNSDEAEVFTDRIMSTIRNATGVDDLMKVQVSDFNVVKSSSASLANPAILKSQLIEFMKYRAPVNLGMGFIDALKAFKNLDKQTKLVENKNEFYKQQTTVLEKLEMAWKKLQAYQYQDASQESNQNFPNGKYLETQIDLVKQDFTDLRDNHIANAVKYGYTMEYFKDPNTKIDVNLNKADTAFDDVWTLGGITYKTTLREKTSVSAERLRNYYNTAVNARNAVETIVGGEDYRYVSDNIGNAQDALVKYHTVTTYNKLHTEYYNAITAYLKALIDLKYAYERYSAKIKEDEKYDSKDEVALYIYTYKKLPSQYITMEKAREIASGKGWNGSGDIQKYIKGNCIGGDKFGNDDEKLPLGKNYKECDIDTYNKDKRGEKRIVYTDDGLVYYTDNNYSSFSEIKFNRLDDVTIGKIKAELKRLDIKGEDGRSRELGQFNNIIGRIHNNYEATKTNYYSVETAQNAFRKTIEDIRAFDQFIQRKIDNLTAAISLLGQVKASLDTGGAYNNAMNSWDSSANAIPDDAMAQADKKEMEKLDEMINKDRIASFITRLESAKTSLVNIKRGISEYKLNGLDFASHEALKPDGDLHYWLYQFHNEIEALKNPTTENAFDNVIDTIKNRLTSPADIQYAFQQPDDPNLQRSEQHAIYTWLYNNYYDPNMSYGDDNTGSNKITAAKENVENTDADIKAQADKLKDDAEKQNRDSAKAQEHLNEYKQYLVSAEWAKLKNATQGSSVFTASISTDKDSAVSDASRGVGSMLGGILDLVKNMSEDLRDDMYLTDYIMRMFTYDTYEAELMVEYGGDSGYSGFEQWYKYSADDKTYTINDNDNYKAAAKHAENLKKYPIDPNMNYLYGSEVEYIIYGGNDIAECKVGAYGSIFLIRFALNTVYAFSDAEINNITQAAATALFGVPPLTPLIPVAKFAMMVAFAIAESSYDLYILKMGKSVPLVKNSKTWQMKPSNAAKIIVQEAAEKVTDYALNEGYKAMNSLLEKTDDELKELITKETSELNQLASSIFDTTIDKAKQEADKAIEKVTKFCNDKINEQLNSLGGRDENGDVSIEALTQGEVNTLISELNSWAEEGDSDVLNEAKKAAVSYFATNSGELIKDVFRAFDASRGKDAIKNELNDKLETVKVNIESRIDSLSSNAESSLHKLRENTVNQLKNAAAEGVESLRNTIHSTINSKLGGGESTVTEHTDSVVSTLLSWSYSDYLTLFLVIGLIANQEAVMTRTADVIQLNIQHMNKEYAAITSTTTVEKGWWIFKYNTEETTSERNEKAYTLSKAYTYLEIEAELEIKPLFLGLPIVAPLTEGKLDGKRWYVVEYSGILGY